LCGIVRQVAHFDQTGPGGARQIFRVVESSGGIMAVPKFIRPCWLNLAALECPSISAVALAVVIGSVRSNRFADHAAGWIVAALSLMTFLSNRTAGVRPEPRY
jgi:hypothetical protein